MPDKTSENMEAQDDDDDQIEKFGTSELLAEWRQTLVEHTTEYTNWIKKAKSLQLKALNMKHSLSKDQLKNTQNIATIARQLNEELSHIPCSSREADDFMAFFEALIWVTDLVQVRAPVRTYTGLY